MFRYFQVFSKDMKIWVNQFLLVISVRFKHCYIFIRSSYVFSRNLYYPHCFVPVNDKYYTAILIVQILRDTIYWYCLSPLFDKDFQGTSAIYLRVFWGTKLNSEFLTHSSPRGQQIVLCWQYCIGSDVKTMSGIRSIPITYSE